MVGVVVENGIVKEGTPLCVPTKEVRNLVLLSETVGYECISCLDSNLRTVYSKLLVLKSE